MKNASLGRISYSFTWSLCLWVDINPTCLLNGLSFFNPNWICLFKWANYVDPFIKFYIKKNSINLIDPKY